MVKGLLNERLTRDSMKVKDQDIDERSWLTFFFFFLEMVDQTIANRRRLFQIISLFVASMKLSVAFCETKRRK